MLLQLEEVSHVYRAGLPGAVQALDRISLAIPPGSFLALIGGNGAGKTTLAWHLNGLLRPTEGRVLADGEPLPLKGEPLRLLRRRVGLAMQYPEQMFFAETAQREVAYGLRQERLPAGEELDRVQETLQWTGLARRAACSPFALSGGEQRRLALACALAQRPEVLVLDEPTAGLDQPGRQAILHVLERLRRERTVTVVLVSHRPEEVAVLADRMVLLHQGRVLREGVPAEMLGSPSLLEEAGLDAPDLNRLLAALRRHGWPVRVGCLNPAEAAAEILDCMVRREGKACTTE